MEVSANVSRPSRPRGGSKTARHTTPRRGLGPLLPSRSQPLPRPPTRHVPASLAPRDLLPSRGPSFGLFPRHRWYSQRENGTPPYACERFLVSGLGTPNPHALPTTQRLSVGIRRTPFASAYLFIS